MYTLPSRDIVLLYYVQNMWEWGGWCGISLIYPYLYLYCGPGAEDIDMDILEIYHTILPIPTRSAHNRATLYPY